jgi:hypothetical protein
LPQAACNFDRHSLSRVFPGIRLVGALRLGFDYRKLIIAALGLALLQIGWSLLNTVFLGSASQIPDLVEASREATIDPEALAWNWETLSAAHDRISEPFRILSSTIFTLFSPRSEWLAKLHALASLAWLFIIWTICGGAICRIAIIQVARTQHTGVLPALGFSLQRAKVLIAAPLLPFLGISLCAAIGAVFGLLYRLPVAGPAIAGVFFFIPLALGAVMTLLVAGLLGGWPLLQAAVASGAEDSLDAFSRVYGYMSQRIGKFVALVGLGWLLGIIGSLLVALLAGGVIRLTLWNLGLGVSSWPTSIERGSEQVGGFAGTMHAFWLGVVRLLAHGWAYSFFWSVAALSYLWLRQDVDGTPWEEIDLPGAPSASARSTLQG